MFDPHTITAQLTQRVSQHQQRLARYLAAAPLADGSATPLAEDVALFVRIASGEIDRDRMDEEQIGVIIERFQGLLDLLFTPAGGTDSYQVPAKFWTETPIGQVLTHVQVWLRRDDLISYTDAAHILFPDMAASNLQAARMRVKRMAERGLLQSYADPRASNPTQQMRVSRMAAEALRAAEQHRLVVQEDS